MEYRISDICSELKIGKSTIYKRIDLLKQNMPESEYKNNEFFFYNENNKLFFTEKGFNYIRDFNTKKDGFRQDTTNSVTIYQNEIIKIYKDRIEYLENENKRLLDIISVKEQKELAKDIKYIDNVENSNSKQNFFYKVFKRFM